MFNALVVGPLRDLRTRVISEAETSATVKGLKRNSWIDSDNLVEGALSGGIER